jgi:hypothetical protein
MNFFAHKLSNSKFCTNFVIIKLGLDPAPDLNRICIQQQVGSGSVFNKIPGSGFSEYGLGTLAYNCHQKQTSVERLVLLTT